MMIEFDARLHQSSLPKSQATEEACKAVLNVLGAALRPLEHMEHSNFGEEMVWKLTLLEDTGTIDDIYHQKGMKTTRVLGVTLATRMRNLGRQGPGILSMKPEEWAAQQTTRRISPSSIARVAGPNTTAALYRVMKHGGFKAPIGGIEYGWRNADGTVIQMPEPRSQLSQASETGGGSFQSVNEGMEVAGGSGTGKKSANTNRQGDEYGRRRKVANGEGTTFTSDNHQPTTDTGVLVGFFDIEIPEFGLVSLQGLQRNSNAEDSEPDYDPLYI